MIFGPAFKQVRRLFEPRHLTSCCSPVQGRMAGGSTSVYEFDSVVRGQHVYKSVWTSLTDWRSKTCKCILVLEDDKRDKYTINDRL